MIFYRYYIKYFILLCSFLSCCVHFLVVVLLFLVVVLLFLVVVLLFFVLLFLVVVLLFCVNKYDNFFRYGEFDNIL